MAKTKSFIFMIPICWKDWSIYLNPQCRISPVYQEIWCRWTETELNREHGCDQIKCESIFLLIYFLNQDIKREAGGNKSWRHGGWVPEITDSHHYVAPVVPVVVQINTVYPARLCSGTSSTQPLITGYSLIILSHTYPHTGRCIRADIVFLNPWCTLFTFYTFQQTCVLTFVFSSSYSRSHFVQIHI